MLKKRGRPESRVTRICGMCGTSFTKRPSEMARRATCSLACGSQARGLRQRWENACEKLQKSSFLYADQLPTFDSICGTYRLHPTDNCFYEVLEDKTVHRYELTPDSRVYRLDDLTEVDPEELPGSAVDYV